MTKLKTRPLAIIMALFLLTTSVPTLAAHAAEMPPLKAAISTNANSPPSYADNNTHKASSIFLTKIDIHGQGESGWEFEVYSDNLCHNRISGPHKTNTSGSAYISQLPAGEYWIRETNIHTSDILTADQHIPAANKVIVKSNSVAEITVMNSYCSGAIEMRNDNSNWAVSVYQDRLCSILLPGSPFKFSGDGTIAGLDSGVYFIREYPISKSTTAADYDPMLKTLSIKSGETVKVEFNGSQYGTLRIKLVTNTHKQLDGWVFRVTDNEGKEVGKYVTDKNGLIEIPGLNPGRYSVIEKPVSDPYWQIPFGFHTVRVEAGNTEVDLWGNTEQGLVWFTHPKHLTPNICIFSDKNCTKKVSSLTARNSGRTGLFLDPGTYFAKVSQSEVYPFTITSRADTEVALVK